MDIIYECAAKFIALERNENPAYLCIVSFFKKDTITYGGDKLYWMLKEKKGPTGCVTLYRHKNHTQS